MPLSKFFDYLASSSQLYLDQESIINDLRIELNQLKNEIIEKDQKIREQQEELGKYKVTSFFKDFQFKCLEEQVEQLKESNQWMNGVCSQISVHLREEQSERMALENRQVDLQIENEKLVNTNKDLEEQLEARVEMDQMNCVVFSSIRSLVDELLETHPKCECSKMVSDTSISMEVSDAEITI
ncbi:interaptin [Tieghemostelium lacteum]|uniref:Interaptin n=1 Tax=Tieghemostelium lacteum TaxID=361077 RepID=A0A151ZDZ9_TIELA|nr:interaptin [Tieghemostelium lacteum]|eukprot:KYQ92183.1 interaptin [Tieghemostelium lacteum]